MGHGKVSIPLGEVGGRGQSQEKRKKGLLVLAGR